MPIFASNFASNSLSGTVRVINGFANINLNTIPYALEGDKSFVIKIRKDSPTGEVLSISPPLAFRDNSSLISVTANVSSVAEGNLVAFSVVTANTVNGANLFYSVFPVTANVTAGDFTANTGIFTITNNAATFALKANADISLMDETGETFKLQVRTTDSVGNVVFVTSNVAIVDTFRTINVLSLSENSTTATEGSPIIFTFTATNVPTGTVLYYSTTGNTTFSPNTGSFAMNSTSNTITLTPSPIPSLQTRIFSLQIRKDSVSGEIIRTSNNIIAVDSGLAYTVASGGTVVDDGGFRTHVFTTSGNLVVSSVGTTYNTIEYQVVAGGGGGGDGYIDYGGGGGGAGGLIYSNNIIAVASTMPIIVGAGGSPAGYNVKATNGSPSVFNANTAIGGGGGGGRRNTGSGGTPAGDGGSGGGGMYGSYPPSGGVDRGSGTPGQGNPGGESMYTTPFGGYTMNSGGGGGAGSRGYTWNDGTYNDGNTANVGGGIGRIAMSLPASYGTPGPAPGRYFAGGGGGGFADRPGSNMVPGPGGAGGGGGGAGRPGAPQSGPGTNGTTNTGGGGGGGSYPSYYTIYPGRTGGSGIVIVRYPYVPPPTFTSITSTSNFSAVAGFNIILTLNTLNLSNNSLLYYSTVGNVISSDFVSGNTGSFSSTGNATTITLATNSNIPANQERFFQLQINANGVGEAAEITSNVITIRPQTTFSAETLAIAGGGSGGGGSGGAVGGTGGGAGGVILTNVTISTGTTYTISVAGAAAGGVFTNPAGYNGSNTILSGGAISITAVGGGAGYSNPNPSRIGANGGSGGGGRFEGGVSESILLGGNGYGFPSPTQQGYPGGGGAGSFPNNLGGGGGAGGAGGPGSSGGGHGGLGINSSITGVNVQYAGGGGGGSLFPGAFGGYGQYGGGNSGMGSGPADGRAANVNTGGGGGGGGRPGGSDNVLGGAGGSGIVVLAYANTLPNVVVVSGNVEISTNTTSRPGYLVHRIIGGTGTISFL